MLRFRDMTPATGSNYAYFRSVAVISHQNIMRRFMLCVLFYAASIWMCPIVNAEQLEIRQSSDQSVPWFGATSIAYGNKTFVVLGYDKDDHGIFYASQNLVDWSEVLTQSFLWDMVYGDNLFVAVGMRGHIVTSSDGSMWTKRTSGTNDLLFGVAYGNG